MAACLHMVRRRFILSGNAWRPDGPVLIMHSPMSGCSSWWFVASNFLSVSSAVYINRWLSSSRTHLAIPDATQFVAGLYVTCVCMALVDKLQCAKSMVPQPDCNMHSDTTLGKGDGRCDHLTSPLSLPHGNRPICCNVCHR